MTLREFVAWGAERFKAFADAVVAIAMTLLILPLMEAVTDAARMQEADASYGTGDFLTEHQGQIVSFALSFVLIAVSWLSHHRLYDQVERITAPLLWINIAWMFTIVCLPVTTALLGAMEADPLQAALYIGNLTLTQVTSLVARVYLLRHDGLSAAPRNKHSPRSDRRCRHRRAFPGCDGDRDDHPRPGLLRSVPAHAHSARHVADVAHAAREPAENTDEGRRLGRVGWLRIPS